MRWRFIDPNNRPEIAEREAIIAKIDSWWRTFQERTADLSALFSRKVEWDLAEWMWQHLQDIDPKLMWEFGPAVGKKGHRLVITPEDRHDLRPLVREILAQIKAELFSRKNVATVATGGYARLLASELPEIAVIHPHLTLEGLRIGGNLN